MLKKKKSSVVKDVAIGASIAAAAGYIAGILTAPKSGKQTRKDIQKKTKKVVAEAEKDLKKVAVEVEDLASQAKKKGEDLSEKANKELHELVEKAKVAKDKAGTVVTAVKKGEAEDVELQRALDQARNAIKNVQKYLKK